MDNQSDNLVAGGEGAITQQFSVGAVLREAREQQGLSVADVANRIKFAPRQIEAMEADDFAHLPEATFVRGFVRSYARLLEIDPTPLLAALPQTHLQAAAVPEIKAVEVPFPSVLSSRRSNIVWLAGGLAIVLVLIIFSRMHDSSPEPEKSVTQANVEELVLPAAITAASAPLADALPAAQAVMPQAMPKSAEQSAAAALKNQSELDRASKKQAAKVQADQELVQKEQAARERAASKQAAREQTGQEQLAGEQAALERTAKKQATTEQLATATKPANGAAEVVSLRLVFDEDSWVDVKDANGKTLLSKMNHAGSLVRLSGTAPLSVVIGHASGVHLFYKNKEVNLAPHTAVEVARLLLE